MGDDDDGWRPFGPDGGSSIKNTWWTPGDSQDEMSIDEFLYEDTEEIICTCGSWKTYGKDSNLHTDYCDISKR
jgi:hypothetical protein